jgi:glycosyltransferase involved in cell wall biosynthesis
LAQLQRQSLPIQVTVLGDGPEAGRWRQLADSLGVSNQLKWTGKLPRKDALLEVQRADVMAFTSLQEGTPHAVLEALSLGLPVICHDACGMGAAVTNECGIKVPMQSPQASIAGFASALRLFCDKPDELARLSAGALRRATELGWAAKGLQIARAYDQVLSSVPAVRS